MVRLACRFFACLVGLCAIALWALPQGVAIADAVGPSSVPKYEVFDASVSAGGCSQLFTAPNGRRMRVWGLRIANTSGTTSKVQLWNASGCASQSLTPAWKIQANTNFDAAGDSVYPIFATTQTSASIYVKSSAATDLAIAITYTDFDPSASQGACDWEDGGVPEWSPAACTTSTNANVTNSVLTTRDNHTFSDRLGVDLDPADVGGGGSGCSLPCDVHITDAGTELHGQHQEVLAALALLVLVAGYGVVTRMARR